MAIEKKSLISTLRTTKKANSVISTPALEAAHKMNKGATKSLKSGFTKSVKATKIHPKVPKR